MEDDIAGADGFDPISAAQNIKILAADDDVLVKHFRRDMPGICVDGKGEAARLVPFIDLLDEKDVALKSRVAHSADTLSHQFGFERSGESEQMREGKRLFALGN